MTSDLIVGYQKVVTIILLIIIGFVCKKKNILTLAAQEGLTNLLMKLIIPCSVLSSFLTPFDREKLVASLYLLGIAFVFYPINQLIFGRLLFSRCNQDEEKKRLFIFQNTYSNTVFMGYPFSQALLGKDGILFTSVFNLPYNIYLWSMGYAYLTKQPMNRSGLKKTITNPVIIACFIGYLWWLGQGVLPQGGENFIKPVKDVFDMVSACSTPFSMILIGALVAESDLGATIKDPQVWYFSAVKLAAVPITLFGVLFLLGFRGGSLTIPVLISAMPVCATGGILAAKYNIKKELAASMVAFTTLLSIVTIPVWLLFLMKFI